MAPQKFGAKTVPHQGDTSVRDGVLEGLQNSKERVSPVRTDEQREEDVLRGLDGQVDGVAVPGAQEADAEHLHLVGLAGRHLVGRRRVGATAAGRQDVVREQRCAAEKKEFDCEGTIKAMICMDKCSQCSGTPRAVLAARKA